MLVMPSLRDCCRRTSFDGFNELPELKHFEAVFQQHEAKGPASASKPDGGIYLTPEEARHVAMSYRCEQIKTELEYNPMDPAFMRSTWCTQLRYSESRLSFILPTAVRTCPYMPARMHVAHSDLISTYGRYLNCVILSTLQFLIGDDLEAMKRWIESEHSNAKKTNIEFVQQSIPSESQERYLPQIQKYFQPLYLKEHGPESEFTYIARVGDDDPRVALRGQAKVNAKKKIPFRTIIGPFTGRVMTETEYDNKVKGASLLEYQNHERYSYNFTCELPGNDSLVLDPYPNYGGQLMVINDYRKAPLPTDAEDPATSKEPMAKKQKRALRLKANVIFIEITYKGWPYLVGKILFFLFLRAHYTLLLSCPLALICSYTIIVRGC